MTACSCIPVFVDLELLPAYSTLACLKINSLRPAPCAFAVVGAESDGCLGAGGGSGREGLSALIAGAWSLHERSESLADGVLAVPCQSFLAGVPCLSERSDSVATLCRGCSAFWGGVPSNVLFDGK